MTHLELWRPCCSVKRNHLFNFERGHHEEQSCEDIRNLDQWFRSRCCLKIFLIWSSGGPFVQQSGTICAIIVEGIMKNIHVKSINLDQWFRSSIVWKISYLEVWRPSCSVERNHLCNFERTSLGTFMWSYMKFWPMVQEEMSFKEKVNTRQTGGQWTKTDQYRSPWAFGSGELKNSSGIPPSGCHTVRIQIRTAILSDMIWVQTVLIGYQHLWIKSLISTAAVPISNTFSSF